MTIWLVRAGRYGEREEKALEEGYSFIGWNEVPDLRTFKTKDKLKSILEQIYADAKPGRINNFAGQIWTFFKVIKQGDIVALPLKNRPSIAFGEVTGDYEYKAENPEDARHCRPVRWLDEPILRSRFDEHLKYSFGGAMTVFRVHRNNAEERIRKMISQPDLQDKVTGEEEPSEPAPNLLSTASQQISDYIGRKFKGRKLEELVDAILKAKGYETDLCREGADGGVDILAGRGAMGFDQRI
jgi:restriction system protein